MARWVVDNREATKDEVELVFAEGLLLAAETLLGDANLTVPHDEGILESSGTIAVASDVGTGGIEAAVGYNTPYAVIQHEDVTFNHPGKGRDHWLEYTLAERADVYQQQIADHIGERLR